MKILALHLSTFFEFAHIRGITDPLIRETEAKLFAHVAPTSTVEAQEFYAVVRSVAHQAKDDLLGVKLGTFMNLKSLGLVYQISLQVSTIAEALYYLQNYIYTTLPVIKVETTVEDEKVFIQLHIDECEDLVKQVVLENILTVISRELSVMVGSKFSYTLNSPFYTDRYPSGWEKGTCFGISFKNTVLKASLQDRSKWKLEVLVPQYLEMIENLKREERFSTKVKIALLSMANPELPSLAKVADTFNLTPRTLQRRLETENTNFRDINLELKKQISGLFIQHERFTIKEISDVLGFAEPASFIHSFKKWYGDSPEKYRQRLAG